MKNILIQQDLQHAILEVEKKPMKTIDSQWKRMDVKVKSSIELHLADNMMFNVDDDINAKETWDKLEKVYRDENTEGFQALGMYTKGKEKGRLQNMYDKSGNRSRSKSKGKEKEKENKGCFTCGVIDYWKKNCKIWQERKAKAMARNSSTASVVTLNESDDELLTVTSSSNAIQHWILDTGCLFYMSANKEWFNTYEERNYEEVLIGDDSPCKIQGI
ncbi:hypothetical protein LWI28_024966 [Acer negundo]|uniref:Retrovirus-related Pol polyprotein from transposon TNT 1-94-like beta-barrel domain-containing protein n=1 Tax=Acer negundo TaxID=4023 RepID=A0AAD5J7C8_ACENE|nr:hypothetical protein LWI28_024966 [Acer negundo]